MSSGAINPKKTVQESKPSTGQIPLSKTDQKVGVEGADILSQTSGKSSPVSTKRISLDLASEIEFDISGMSIQDVNRFIADNTSSQRLGPDLIKPEEASRIKEIDSVYKIRKNQEAKEAFRLGLVDALHVAWKESFGLEKADELKAAFSLYAKNFSEHGVGIIGDLISKQDFAKLIDSYTQLLDQFGNKTWLHSFVDLRNHPDFLMNPEFNGAFLHPLNIALMAHAMGGPIRMTDARAKDAQPLCAVTLDNMLHIDNAPYTSEIKQTTFWKLGQAVGPDGQCFVCLPGTQRCPRAADGILIDDKPVPFASLTDSDRAALMAQPNPILYTTEAGSVFRTTKELEGALAAQKRITGCEEPVVVALRDDQHVITATAETGNLVHHRYRIPSNHARSCLLIAFHLIEDDPGQLITADRLALAKSKVQGSDLDVFVLGSHKQVGVQLNQQFLDALVAKSLNIGMKLEELNTEEPGNQDKAVYIAPSDKAMTPEEVAIWKDQVIHGPGSEAIKRTKQVLVEGEKSSRSEFINKIKKLMSYDKTGVLELILYSDGREEKRKWVRNQIRELRLEAPNELKNIEDVRPPSLDARFEFWAPALDTPKQEDLLSKKTLGELSELLVKIAQDHIDRKTQPTYYLKQQIASEAVLPAVKQLIGDLGIAIQNCTNREAFLSTGLFMFWVCDTLMRVVPCTPAEVLDIRNIGDRLLKHYVAMAVIIEKQMNESVSRGGLAEFGD